MENEKILIIQFQLTRFKVLAILTALFICFHPKLLGSEQLTLTTYYPSPYGGYAKLLTTKDTVLARDGGGVGVGYSNPGSAKLAVNGRVGIGTTAPGEDLDVRGNVKWGTRRGLLKTDQGASIELGGRGTPYIDFSNDSWTDYDARLMLRSNNQLRLYGARLGIDRNPSYPLDVQGNARVVGDMRITGKLRGMCRTVYYSTGFKRCGWNERVFGHYGDGIARVVGFLPANGSMSGAGRYIALGQDWRGWMLCCRIQ
ncbi:MAG: hypothetical protein U9Q34_03250 [Elusimicrobiota bacterium]|nr:hypothetical protein [Elusimicrobiota bacterium]